MSTRSSDAKAQAGTKEKLWTPANIVTMIRICFVPVFVIAIISPWPAWIPQWHSAAQWQPWVAAFIFILLAATDGVDGYLARSRNEVTNFGKFIDPLADKILVAAALLALTELSVLPSWVALVILCREFIVSGIRMIAASQGVVIAASWYGKAKTVFQIIAIVLFIVKDSLAMSTSGLLASPLYLISWAVMLVALVLTIVSMLDYFVKARFLLGFSSKEGQGEAEGEGIVCCASQGEAASAEHVLAAARAQGKTIATAESLTGGMIAAALTAVPGSSDVVLGGVVSYASAVKRDVLRVPEEVLNSVGAVSEEAACAMAEGARRQTGADVTVSVTGIAGPGGAEPGKPVGTVWMGIATAEGTCATQHCFEGDRAAVREQTVDAALGALLEKLSPMSDSR